MVFKRSKFQHSFIFKEISIMSVGSEASREALLLGRIAPVVDKLREYLHLFGLLICFVNKNVDDGRGKRILEHLLEASNGLEPFEQPCKEKFVVQVECMQQNEKFWQSLPEDFRNNLWELHEIAVGLVGKLPIP